MSIKSKLSALATAYKSACADSKNAWQNTDCSISDSVKESTKITFALWVNPSISNEDGYRMGHSGYGYYCNDIKIHN
ncbi:hypothetical protein E4T80_11795 [Muribacter muris]|uniref:Uncharacterized protein n=1 Tax=Muribacter muris TaxID=67855 RepID=A0A4Y9JPU5_9PAST|nr:hypothetical protein [Muribacter muris]MBF0786142.1 hypothetical protein [Muribacter muris]MBF0827337.1 hypothetical protein [Muribacter muris]TFV07814.1 hypothetical protein E4T80_11795 [Muribacter muris]